MVARSIELALAALLALPGSAPALERKLLAGDGARATDRLNGDRGRDRLAGSRVNDRLAGGRARDRLGGGPGRDRQRQ